MAAMFTPNYLKLSLTILVLYLNGAYCKTNYKLSLDGTWIAKEREYWYEFPATVPGGVYTDLMNLGIIDDIFYGYNDNSTRWVGNINWTYALNFTVDPAILDYEHVNLVFEGVDTFATIELNNVTIGETKNMFLRYIFDVRDIIKGDGNNTLKVFFENPVEKALKLYNEQLSNNMIPSPCPTNDFMTECHVNMIRKMQASFSWDFAPSFPSMGIWKPVFIECFDESAIRYLQSRVVYDDSVAEIQWYLSVDTFFEQNKRGYVQGTLLLEIFSSGSLLYKYYNVNASLSDRGDIFKGVIMTIEEHWFSPWWPNGYGDQPLYELHAQFMNADDHNDVYDSKSIMMGVKTIELVQEPLDNGASFFLRINRKPIFIKGANLVPINILPELIKNPEAIRNLLQSAKDANMNMLRVWGGGTYLPQEFYNLADQLGIMIWHDFMFSNALYPATEEFLKNALDEVQQNLNDLWRHPSVMIYCGNSEVERLLASNYNSDTNLNRYMENYLDLFNATIKLKVNQTTGSTAIFVNSSPSNGNWTQFDTSSPQDPNSELWGDMHYFNYTSDPWDPSSYPIPRFASEYGFQSLPFEDTWMTATNDTSDLIFDSQFMKWRQHRQNGNQEIAHLIAENLNLPSSDSDDYSSAMIYLSEVYAAQAMRMQTEHYRRYRSYLTEDGRGMTMGALFWHLNDVWVAPSWSSIDYTGRWKMLHYFAKDFFSDVIVTGYINPNRELLLFTVNDKLTDVENATLRVRIYKYDSSDFEPVYENSYVYNLYSGTSKLVQSLKTDDLLSEQNCDKNTCFFHLILEDKTNGSVIISPQNYVFPGKLKEANLPKSNLVIEAVTETEKANTFEVTLTSDNIALFVWVDSHVVRGRFSENGFMQVLAVKTVEFYSDSNITANELQKYLTVRHLTS
ncbi:beta-mannosidase-like isoform X1 [Anthonomus grandis grandis]|uniref:beta-mannosidase-like isoform X1 n=1 Tax=Anthonomus grandis grandis TaxID=2921223 RepID=UPI00216633A8|nr:beta-mannosidase-like isoform X1 [Anthonomus grandis grandis]